jgi:hypothetical protein
MAITRWLKSVPVNPDKILSLTGIKVKRVTRGIVLADGQIDPEAIEIEYEGEPKTGDLERMDGLFINYMREGGKTFTILDTYEPSKLRNLTLAQVNTTVDNISDLASAKVIVKKLAQVVLWLLKKEMNQL